MRPCQNNNPQKTQPVRQPGLELSVPNADAMRKTERTEKGAFSTPTQSPPASALQA